MSEILGRAARRGTGAVIVCVHYASPHIEYLDRGKSRIGLDANHGSRRRHQKGLTESLENFTKQRKAEEKRISAGRWRRSRMVEARGKFLKEAAEEVLEECYMKASDNGNLPATARQVYYVARPLFENLTDKSLLYGYFSQTLLPDYIKGRTWRRLGCCL